MRFKNFILFSFIFFLISCTPTYIVTLSGSTGGTVSDVGGEFDEGTVISVTAQPDTGYEFQGWSDGSNQNPRTITVTESLDLTALFSKKQISLNVSIQGGGTVLDESGNSPSEYEFGSAVKLIPKSNEGYYFVGWEVFFNVSEVSSSPELAAYTSALQAQINAIQAFNSARISEVEGGLAVFIDSVIDNEVEFLQITSGLDSIYEDSDQFSISIPVFTELSITAKFAKRLYVLNVSSGNDGGSISLSDTSFNQRYLFQPYGTSVVLTGQPAQGWEFNGWTGDIESESNPLTLSLEKNLSVNAEFIRKKFDINVSIEGEGTVIEEVIVQPSQYDYETQVKLTATAEEYWKFIEWSGDVDSNENPLIVTIDNTKSLTAKFAKKDSDNDGVTDDVDQCPNTPEGVAVDENGCALDSDNDGVNDDIDLCLDTPEGAEVDSNGCAASQKDTDNDGISDDIDSCPTEGGTYIDEVGCPIPPIKVHSNGVTIVAESWAEVGTEYTLNGKTYKIVDRTMLDDMITTGQDLSTAVTSKITNFSRLFYNKVIRNTNLESWDTSNVDTMYLFAYQSNFNSSISKWDVRKVTTMFAAFADTPFSGDISEWNTESLTDLRSTFSNTTAFNSELNNWDTSKVTSMNQTFGNADGFNRPLDKWDVSKVTNMNFMFRSAKIFNQDLTSWCVKLIFFEPVQFSSGETPLQESNKPKWGTCPDESSADTGSGGDSAGDTSGSISFIKFSEAKACVNNVCDVTLGMRFSNGTTESITVNKIEVYTNGSLTTTYTSGDALGSYAAGQAKSFSISLDNATSGKVIVYYTASGVSGIKEYNWTNN